MHGQEQAELVVFRVVAVVRQYLPVGGGEFAQLFRGPHVHRDEEIQSHAGGEVHAVEGTRGGVDGRMGLLHRLGVGDDVGDPEETALIVHGLLGPRQPDDLDAFLHDVPDVLVFHAEALVGAGVGMPAAGGKAHPAVAQHVQGGGLLGELHGVVDGKGVDRNPQAQVPGALGGGSQHHVRGGQEREAGGEVDLGYPVAVVAQVVGQLGLFEKLHQQFGGNASRGALHFGKEADLHRSILHGVGFGGRRAHRVLYPNGPWKQSRP